MSKIYKRIYHRALAEMTPRKMLFVSGPRQIGKTTLTQGIQKESWYLSWDIPEDKKVILKEVFTKEVVKTSHSLLILDEIHKYNRFKNALKGLYDRKIDRLKIIVTGSARLDLFQKSGDSLVGRYESLRVHPLSLGELTHQQIVPPPRDWLSLGGNQSVRDILDRLKKRGGFPEPYFEDSDSFYLRWSSARRSLLIKEDLREISNIKMASKVEELGIILPERVGSLLSVNSVKEDLGVSHESTSTWLNVFEKLYFIYRIRSYQKSVSRGIKKAQKLYLWDWAQVENPGAKMENLVASHLLKSVHLWNDLGLGEFELSFLRNKEGHEIDFVVLNKRKPVVAIEVKTSQESLSESWFKFERVLQSIPKIQLTVRPDIDQVTASGVRLVSVDLFLQALN